MSEGWEEKGTSLGALRIISGIREDFIPKKASPGWKGEYGPWPWPCAFIIIFLAVDQVEHHYFHRYANVVVANYCYC